MNLKEITSNGEVFKTVLRLVTSKDNPTYKNSIITFMKIDGKEWNRRKRKMYKSRFWYNEAMEITAKRGYIWGMDEERAFT